MAINVYFNNSTTPIDPIYIVGIKQSAHSLSSNFKPGGTVCRTFEIDIIKSAVGTTHPSYIRLDGDSGAFASNAAKLFIDDIDDTNEAYYKYKVADAMINMGFIYDWGTTSTAPTLTVSQALTKICGDSSLGIIGSAPTKLDDGTTNIYGVNIPVALSSSNSPRDFVSWVAELQGGYAYINAQGRLAFSRYKAPTSVNSISKNTCSSYKVSLEHKITRVVYNSIQPVISGDDSGETIYVNMSNKLFTDTPSSPKKISDCVTHIKDCLYNFSFYNIHVDKCSLLPNVKAGQSLTIGGKPTIAQIDWTYNGTWQGGYDLQLDPVTEQETQVIGKDYDNEINEINTRIDNIGGTLDIEGINRRITEVGERIDVVHFRVRSAQSDVIITNEQGDNPKAYTSFKGSGMEIYVDGVKVAEATKDKFNCNKGLGVRKWVIQQGNSENVLIFFKGV